MEHSFSKRFTIWEFIKFILPAIFSMVFLSLYTIIDGVFVSKLVGSDALASINIVLPSINLFYGIGIMFATGGSALIAISLGQKKFDDANNKFSLLTLLIVILGAIIGSIGVIFNTEIFTFLGATEKLMPFCKEYGIIILASTPIFMLKMILEYFTRTDGAFKFSLFTSILGGIINILFDYIFIAILGFGIAGAAIATFLGAFVSVLFSIGYFFTKHSTLKYVVPKFDFKLIKDSAINGSSEMVTELSTAITTILFNLAAMSFAGEDGVAAVTIILYAHFLMVSTYLGFISGVAPLVSYNYGAQNKEKLKELSLYSNKFIFISSIIIFILCLTFAPYIVTSFVANSSNVYNLALNGLRIFSIAFIFTGLNIYASGLFTAFSNGKISAIISFSRAFVFIIVGFLFLPKLIGINGLWLIVPFAELITLIFSILYLKKYKETYSIIF